VGDPKSRADRAGLTFAILFFVTMTSGLVTVVVHPALSVRRWLTVLALLALATAASSVWALLLNHRHKAWQQNDQPHRGQVARRGRQYATLPRPTRRAVQAWSVGLIGWLVCLVMILPAWVTWSQLGGHRGESVINEVEVHPRYRQTTTVRVVFRTEEGTWVSTNLRAVAQDDGTYYKPGTHLYYDRHDPRIAISKADYDDGSPHNRVVLGLATGVFAGWTYWTVRVFRKHWAD
jgi:hypothetical protein